MPLSTRRPPPPSLAARGLLALVGTYRVTLAAFMGGHCRFWPSCSIYAREAFLWHGAWRGCRLVAGRILRCHPWHPGGIDCVPQAAP